MFAALLLLLLAACGGGAAPGLPDAQTAGQGSHALSLGITGTGTVVSSPASLSCSDTGGTCIDTFAHGTLVMLTAQVPAGSSFSGWGGDAPASCGTALECQVSVDTNRVVTATFSDGSQGRQGLTVTVDASGSGTVRSAPAGVECTTTCTAQFDTGTTVTLTALPSTGYQFSKWTVSGATCAPESTTCVVNMDVARSVTASFVPLAKPRLALQVALSGQGEVRSLPAGIACGTSCLAEFDEGTEVSLAAIAAPGQTFAGWSGDCSGNGSCVLPMAAARAVTARFEPLQASKQSLSVALSGSGSVVSAPAGIDCGGQCTALFDTGAGVSLSAVAGANARFTGWGGACSGTGSCNVTMGDSTLVTASFAPVTYLLAVSKTGPGTVIASGGGIDCGLDCSENVNAGTSVTLVASPATGYSFAGWSGACSGTAACTVTMDAARNVVASFSPVRYDLTVTLSGSGRVQTTSAGIDCGVDCSEAYLTGTSVSLIATPAAGQSFSGWGGDCAGTAVCSLSMSAARSVTVRFEPTPPQRYALSVAVGGAAGGGSVSSLPAGIQCGSDCTEDLLASTSVVLSANAAAGYSFAGWGGACSGSSATCQLTMNAAQSVTASFVRTTFALVASVSGPGSVTSAPVGISCGSSCSASFDSGTLVTLTPSPIGSSAFTGWTGACSGSGACVVTLDAARTVGANFVPVYSLAIGLAGSGTVQAIPGTPASCSSACTLRYNADTAVTLSATPAAGFTFAGWSGACTGTGTCSVTMGASQAVTANFLPTYGLALTLGGSGSVTFAPAGGSASCSSSCNQTYDSGTVVSLTATPAAGYAFSGWSGACAGTGACSVTMNAAKAVTASFVPSYPLGITLVGTGSVSLSSSAGTDACSAGCSRSFNSGSAVTLAASPSAGFAFAGWSGACTGTGSCTLTINAASTVTATFVPTYNLALTVSGSGSVAFSPAGGSASCSANCGQTYSSGTVVSLAATPAAGYAFSGWSGACTGSAACSVTMSAARTVTANFVPTYSLSLTLVGNGNVAFLPAGGSANCGASCGQTYNSGTVVSLTATPAAGYAFTGWSGACTGSAACSVTMGAATAVTATFVPTYSLAITIAGTGGVGLSSSAGTDSCSTSCARSFNSGTVVTLAASPSPGFAFTGWGGACTGTGTCAVTMSAAASVTATFVPTYNLALTVSGSGSVAFSPAGGSGSCSTNCSQTYNSGTVVALAATPAAGYAFTGWSGACTGSGACSVTMGAAASVTATFVPTFNLALTVSGSGSVAFSPAGGSASCSTSCSQTYNSGTVVALTATPAAGYAFTGWSGACTGSAACSVTMGAATAVTATFVPTYGLTLTVSGSGSVGFSPAGGSASCSTGCSQTYNSGTVVALTAAPAAGYAFTGWNGACTGTGACSVTMSAAKAVTASFVPTYSLGITIAGTGGVGLSSIAGTDSCSSSCARSFNSGTVVTLAASPSAGFAFTGWSGACAGSGTCTVTMSAAATVSATFVPSYSLGITITGTGGVGLSSSAGTDSCSASCTRSFNSGTVVTLAASPSAGFAFTGWGGACTGTGTCAVTMSAAANVTASFVPTYSLTLTVSGSGSVAFSPAGGSASCGASCSQTYNSGTTVTLSATPLAGWAFSGWTGACTGSAGCSVSMTAARSVTATFVSTTVVLTVAPTGSGTVVSSPAGINCPGACSASFAQGATVVLTATPSTGSTFGSWAGTGVSCSGLGPCSVSLTSATTVATSFRAVTLVTDTRTINIPSAGTYPAKGAVVVDPATGFNVIRATEKTELTGDYGGVQSAMSTIVYSRYTPSNTTGEFVIVHGNNSTSAWVYRTATNTPVTILRFKPSIGQLSRSIGEVNELRWDYTGQHPNRIYFVGRSLPNSQAVGTENVGMSFYYLEFDPVTGVQSAPVLVRDFSADFPGFANAEIMNDVEGDSSNDSRYWAWQVMNTSLGAGYQPYAVFAYDKTNNQITGRLQRSCTGAPTPCTAINTPATPAPYLTRPNMVEMSPLGTRVIVDFDRAYTGHFDANVGTVADGPKAFLRDFTDPIRIGADATHSGWAWGKNGEELFVSQNNRNDWVEAVNILNATTANCQLIGTSGNSFSCGTKLISQVDLDGGTYTIGYHFGKIYDQTKRGWVYMNTNDSTYNVWGKNQEILVQVNDATVTPSKFVRLGSTYNVHYDYFSEGSGALDFKAENIWATANWGFTDGRGEVVRIQLPAGIWTMLPN